MKRENKPVYAGITRVYLTVLAMVSLLSLPVSCTKDDSSLPIIENAGEPVAVKIIPSGIALYGSVTESGATRSVSGKKVRVHFLEDFDEENMLETIIESVPEEVAVPTRAVNLTSTTMRVVVCNSTGDIVTQCAYDVSDGVATPQAGQSLLVPNSSTAYTFHCYSPANAIDTSTKKVTVNAGENFAYNKVTQVINSSSLAATVTIPALTPMMSKIKYSVSSTVFPGTITCTGSVKGTFATGTTADWTLGDAALTSTTAADQLLEFTENNQEQTVFSTGMATGKLTLTIADLKIGGVTKMTPTLSTANEFTLEAGKRYTVSIDIRKKNYIEVANFDLKVAKGNLMKKNGKWQLAPDQGWCSVDPDGGDYFSLGIADPLQYGPNVYGNSMDELTAGCVEVLGEGWRIPDGTDGYKFTNNRIRVYSTYVSVRGTSKGMYFGTTSAEEARERKDTYIFFPYTSLRWADGSMCDQAHPEYWEVRCWLNYPGDAGGLKTAYLNIKGSNSVDINFGMDAECGFTLRCVSDK